MAVQYSYSDFDLEVSKGLVQGHRALNKFGHNEAVGTSFEDIWSLGGTYAFPASASTMTVSSASTADTSAGTGARTVDVQGLDANYLEVSETITLLGQTAVTSTNSYLRVNRMIVRTAGSGGVNAGIIYIGTGTVTTGVPAVKYGAIAIGDNQTLQAHYTVPASNALYVRAIKITSGAQKETDTKLLVRPENEVFQIKWESHFYQDGVPNEFTPPIVIAAKSDIRVQALVDATTTKLAVSYDGILVLQE